MRRTREPFYGMPEDLTLLPDSERERFLEPELIEMSMGDGGPDDPGPVTLALGAQLFKTHPDAVEKGIELPLGFHQHQGENRTTRRAAVANWQPPKVEGEKPPTRRALLRQRQNHQRGKLDPELRRLQRKALK